jgi:hypothetical protein
MNVISGGGTGGHVYPTGGGTRRANRPNPGPVSGRRPPQSHRVRSSSTSPAYRASTGDGRVRRGGEAEGRRWLAAQAQHQRQGPAVQRFGQAPLPVWSRRWSSGQHTIQGSAAANCALQAVQIANNLGKMVTVSRRNGLDRRFNRTFVCYRWVCVRTCGGRLFAAQSPVLIYLPTTPGFAIRSLSRLAQQWRDDAG